MMIQFQGKWGRGYGWGQKVTGALYSNVQRGHQFMAAMLFTSSYSGWPHAYHPWLPCDPWTLPGKRWEAAAVGGTPLT